MHKEEDEGRKKAKEGMAAQFQNFLCMNMPKTLFEECFLPPSNPTRILLAGGWNKRETVINVKGTWKSGTARPEGTCLSPQPIGEEGQGNLRRVKFWCCQDGAALN